LVSLPSEPVTPHVSGCAHSEAYYNIDPVDKKVYLRDSLSKPTPYNEESKRKVIILSVVVE